MKKRKSKILISNFAAFSIAVIVQFMFIAGCGPKRDTEEPICEGKATVVQAVEALRNRQTSTLSMQAAIHCVMEFQGPQGKKDTQDFNGKMIFVGPDNLRLGGDKFGPILIGANEKEFWFYVKPGVDTAWWGEKKNVPLCADKLGFNPFHIAEALGQIDLDLNWTLEHQPGFDILSAPDVGGSKKVYINCCTYQIERIEYYDITGNMTASADLSDYRDVPQVGCIPQDIELRHFRSGQTDSLVRLELSGIYAYTPTRDLRQLFERPVPRGYKSVYRWTENCEFVFE